MLRKILQTGAILILFTTDAYCQLGTGGNTGNSMPMGMGTLGPSERSRTPEEIQRDRQIESQYNRTVNDRIPDKKPSSTDPWGKVRPAPATQQAR